MVVAGKRLDQTEAAAANMERRFDPFRVAVSPKCRSVVQDVIKQLQGYENHFGLRKRRRKKQDQKIFEETVTAITCDVMYSYLQVPRQQVFIGLSNRHLGRRSRYRGAALGKKLPEILRIMSAPEMGFLEISKGTRRTVFENKEIIPGRQTVLDLGPKLISRTADLELSDFGRSELEELIVLKAPKKRDDDPGDWMEYEDTDQTNRWRQELRVINRWIARADIELQQSLDEKPIDESARRLLRIFNDGSFCNGGRLFGGFWQNLPKDRRREDLLINGELVREADYGQMALRLLYAREGAKAPDGDLYAVPKLEGHRDGVKRIINSALYSNKVQYRMPKNTGQYFPPQLSFSEVADAIAEMHGPVAHQFFKGIGMELMFLESEIMIAVLLALKNEGIVALPIHDGVLVSEDAIEHTTDQMSAVFKARTGISPIIRIE